MTNLFRVQALKDIGIWMKVGHKTFLSEADTLRYEKKGWIKILDSVSSEEYSLLKILAKYHKIFKGYNGAIIDKRLFTYLIQDIIREYKSGGNPLRDEVAQHYLYDEDKNKE